MNSNDFEKRNKSFLAFAKEHGMPTIVPRLYTNPLTGDEVEYKALAFVHPKKFVVDEETGQPKVNKKGEKLHLITWTSFSKELGELTKDEVLSMYKELSVIEWKNDDGKTRYTVYKNGKSWIPVELEGLSWD